MSIIRCTMRVGKKVKTRAAGEKTGVRPKASSRPDDRGPFPLLRDEKSQGRRDDL